MRRLWNNGSDGGTFGRGRWALRRAERLALALSFVALTITGMLLTAGRTGSVPSAGATALSATFYGANTTLMNRAIGSIWPQYTGAYCGIAAVEAQVNYDDEVRGVSMYFGGRSVQSRVAAANQRYGQSRWGHATPTNPYGGITNIAPDFGTDPRSIAYMAYQFSLKRAYFHDYIYRWQFWNRTAPSFYAQVEQATTSLGRALEAWHEPVNVVINGGLHSVLVMGIYAYNDPATHYPAAIASVFYRDPEAWPSVSRFQVDFSTWAGGHFSTPYGVYSLWSLYYGDRYTRGDGKNWYDPEPTVGPYRPNSAHPVHWYRGFTWIQRDNHYASGTYSPDFSYTSTGVLMTAP
jgi:hypothetical protein